MSDHENKKHEENESKSETTIEEVKTVEKTEPIHKIPGHKENTKNGSVSVRKAAVAGFVGGAVLIGLIWAVVANYHYGQPNRMMPPMMNQNVSMRSGRPRMNRNVDGMPSMMGINNDFGNFQGFTGMMNGNSDVRRLQQSVDNTMGGLSQPNYLTQSAMPSVPSVQSSGSVISMQSANGKFSYYINGQTLSLPYQLQNGKLVLQVKSLHDFMNANNGDTVAFSIMTMDGQTVAAFNKVSDLNVDQLSYDLKDGQRYLMNLKIADGQGKQVLNASQML